MAAKVHTNGKVDHDHAGKVAEALAASKARTSKVPGGYRIDAQLESFIAWHPGCVPDDMVTVIEERTASALSLLDNFFDSIIAAAVTDLRYLPVRRIDELDPPPRADREVARNNNLLLDNSWGGRIADDLGQLRGDWCTLKPHEHGACLHIREGERITGVTPVAVTVCADGGEPRVIDHVELVAAHRPIGTRQYKYNETHLDPLRRRISDYEQRIADRKRADSNPDRGIEYDLKE
jgi:hypothetical protein